MKSQNDLVYTTLASLGIDYTKTAHPPVFTVEEADQYWADIEGLHCKNLFLRNNKGKRHFLLVAESSSPVDLKSLGAEIGERLGFASPERLMKYLGLTPGSVSPFGLINDLDHHVEVFIDSKVNTAKFVNFHPNINTATLTLSVADFEKYLNHTGNRWTYINLDSIV